MIDMTDPQKRKLAELVRRMARVFKAPNDPEDLLDAIKAHGELRTFIEDDWQRTADLSYADMGELWFEAVMCECAMVIEVGTDEHHDVNCDMWDSKADPGD